MLLRAPRLFFDGWFRRNRARIAGFVSGVAVQLVLAGMVAAILSGGLSDRAVSEPSPYVLF